ncbi:hypothetical protein [Gordonia aichiensis]|nr:hypothetical protein [Gordonia aichiensis]
MTLPVCCALIVAGIAYGVVTYGSHHAANTQGGGWSEAPTTVLDAI